MDAVLVDGFSTAGHRMTQNELNGRPLAVHVKVGYYMYVRTESILCIVCLLVSSQDSRDEPSCAHGYVYRLNESNPP